jgi:Zn-dependent oligopeptidase
MAPPAVATTLCRPNDQLYRVIGDGNGEAGFYREVLDHARKSRRSRRAMRSFAWRAEWHQAVALFASIYERIKAIKPPADEPTRLYLTRVLSAFERAGIALDDAGRAKAQVLTARSRSSIPSSKANHPEGGRGPLRQRLPSWMGVFRRTSSTPTNPDRTARSRSGPIPPITSQCLTYAKSPELRQRFYREYQLRATPD